MFSILETNVTIMVKDMAKSISFYKNVLGFSLIRQYGEHYAQVSAPGIIIGLHPSKSGSNTTDHIQIGFTVDNMSSAKEKLEKNTIALTERSEEGGKFIHFKDPDGTPLYFIDPKR
ncbi:MAG TPA: VOC family protein [Chitinophagaceae bacterium]|nr:VOC family protein [Chitinophagaceae bacterium]